MYMNKFFSKTVRRLILFVCIMQTCMLTLLAQQGNRITGAVTDDTGGPLPGVNVVIKGTNIGVVTGADGTFSITAPDDAVLEFSFVGYATQEIAVGNQTVIDVTMSEDSRQLEEAVVIGYGTARRRDLIGSVSSVSAEQLKDIPISSVAVAMQGKMPGVQVTQTEGAPDAEIKIRIRGGGSITQDNSPLYIIDGFPVENLNAVAPTDIASIDVLKDASSTAIYGARGANGVVIITTKSGYEGKATVSFNTYYGIKQNTKFFDVLDPYEFAFWQYEIMGPSNDFKYFLGEFEDLEIYKDMKATNWQKEILGQTGTTLYNNLSLNGGTKNVKYNVSVTRNDDKEIMMGSGNTRTTFAARTNYVVNNWLDVEMNLRLSDQTIKGAGTSRNSRLNHIVYRRPIEGISSLLYQGEDYEVFSNLTMNPLKQTQDDYRRNATQTFSYNGAFNIKFLKNFTYRFAYNTYYTKENIKIFYGLNTGNAYTYGQMPLAENDNIARRFWQVSNTLSYHKRDFIPGHNLNVLAGQEISSGTSERIRGSVRYLPKNMGAEGGLAMMNMGVAQPVYTMNPAADNLGSFFGRVIYDYRGKYSFTATARADRSSRFAPGYQWGVFPSTGVAWRISDENFMNWAKPVLSSLRFRASYGQAGNNRIGSDAWKTTFGVNTGQLFMDGPLGEVTPYLSSSTTLANPILQWETTTTRNMGLDFALWNHRLNGTVEAYRNTTADLLISATIPSNAGYSRQWQNIGKTSNKGIEITLNGVIIERSDFRLSGSFNIGFNKNRIDKLGETKRWTETVVGGAGSSAEFLIEEGGKVGLMYGYELDDDRMYSFDDFDYHPDELNHANKYTLKPDVADNRALTVYASNLFRPGSIKFKKQIVEEDGSMVVNENDKVILGDANPKHTGGFSISAEYKGFDFSAFFNWVYGNSIYNVNKLNWTTYYATRRYSNMLSIMDSNSRFINYNPVTGDLVSDPHELAELNKDAKYWSCLQQYAPLHSWAIEDGSFLRLNNLTIGYSLPQKIISRVNIQQLRIYVTGYNLWIWTNYTGYDPEVDSVRTTPLTPGCDYNAYPRSRTYNIGLNLTF